MSEVFDRLEQQGVLPLLDLPDLESAAVVLAAFEDAGLSCVEVVLRAPGALDVIVNAAARGMCVGAGTVLSGDAVRAAATAGASFAVSPGFDASTVKVAQAIGVPIIPGVATPSEVIRARHLGVKTVKLFPVTPLGGPAMVRAMAAPFRDMRFVPTGGVREEDVAEYLSIPEVLAVGGSWMAPAELISDRQVEDLRDCARRAAAIGRRR